MEEGKIKKCCYSWQDIKLGPKPTIIDVCRKFDKPCEKGDCEKCKSFKSKYIEYPITVDSIKIDDFTPLNDNRKGKLVKIRPCGEEYGNKTYLGLYLGEVPCFPHISYQDEKILNVKIVGNPGIYVFDLKKIIYGCESWWQVIEKEEDLENIQISDKDIENVWYMKMLKELL